MKILNEEIMKNTAKYQYFSLTIYFIVSIRYRSRYKFKTKNQILSVEFNVSEISDTLLVFHNFSAGKYKKFITFLRSLQFICYRDTKYIKAVSLFAVYARIMQVNVKNGEYGIYR